MQRRSDDESAQFVFRYRKVFDVGTIITLILIIVSGAMWVQATEDRFTAFDVRMNEHIRQELIRIAETSRRLETNKTHIVALEQKESQSKEFQGEVKADLKSIKTQLQSTIELLWELVRSNGNRGATP